MSSGNDSNHDRWAALRHAIIGPLLAAPPERGELAGELRRLSEKTWKHPVTGAPVRFGVSTLERWLSAARSADNPMRALRRQVRKDAGSRPSMRPAISAALRALHRQHPSWSTQLHRDNLVVLSEEQELGAVPSASTVRRWMREHGLVRQPRRRQRDTESAAQARHRFETREVRSYEAAHVNHLWHVDFHDGSRNVLTRNGRWRTPQLVALIDDCSRLCCHAQWYLDEAAQTLVHGSSQAFQKRKLPREVMFDGGAAMKAAEFLAGLQDLGIETAPTLAYSPEQNAKCEVWWTSIEGRLMPMLEGVKELTLELLNEATVAFVEGDYNRGFHSEIGTTPLARFLEGRDVGRECPSSDELRRAFRCDAWRTQRRSDGTLTVLGRRFEVPNRMRHIQRLRLRFARWDLSAVDAVDPRDRTRVLSTLYPLDKTKNADGLRRRLARLDESEEQPGAATSQPQGMAPLLRKLMADYAATGLPPAYLADHRGGRELDAHHDAEDEDAADGDVSDEDQMKEIHR
jgi:transposase InsO family protein